MILEQVTYALASAWLFTLLLGVVGCMPQRPNARPAVSTTAGTLFIMSWAGGLWGCVFLGFDQPHPFPYVGAAMLGALALATLSVPVQLRGPRLPRAVPPRRRLVTIPSPGYWALVLALAIAVLARYAIEALV